MMPIAGDVAALVRSAFGGREVFSCLTGSIAAGTAAATSDIDIVVVLDDQVPVPAAYTMRIAFTRAYLDLHRRYDRHPDRDWPGEVCYLRDLSAAINGAAFIPGHDVPHPIGPECSFHYLLAMVATGLPTTGHKEFSYHARQCATALARYAFLSAASNVADRASVEALLESCETMWHLPPSATNTGTLLHAAVEMGLATYGLRGDCPLRAWKARSCPNNTMPALDRHIHLWRAIANGTESCWATSSGDGAMNQRARGDDHQPASVQQGDRLLSSRSCCG